MEILKRCAFEGEITLRSGEKSDHYFDLRLLMSSPSDLVKIAELIKREDLTDIDVVCGVPYGVIPLVTAVSIVHKIPQIMLRKEKKEYGRGKEVEGEWEVGNKVLLIDDVWTSGTSMNEAKARLELFGLQVAKMIVVVWRPPSSPPKNVRYLFHGRKILESHTAVSWLRDHIYHKGNICFAADCENVESLIEHVDRLKSKISVLKLHPDIIKGWDDASRKRIIRLAFQNGFLLWVDLKLCDVQHIMLRQMDVYHWANLISVMSIVGKEALKELQKAALRSKTRLIIVDSLTTGGERIWTDSRKWDHDKMVNIAGTVGTKHEGLVYIKAGVKDGECLEGVDLIVKGRSLMI